MGTDKNIKLHIVTDIKYLEHNLLKLDVQWIRIKDLTKNTHVIMIASLRKLVGDAAGEVRYYGKLGKPWLSTAAVWGGCLAALGVYMTEWKVITENIPFYNGKYKHEVPK